MAFEHLLVILFVATCAWADDPEVKTPLGSLRGSWGTSRNGDRYMEFKGIPYAKPPVGALRFQPPVQISNWTTTRDAKEFGPPCIQYTDFPELQPDPIQGSEDCLYLNVFTKNLTRNSPVMFYIHGGAYKWGSAQIAGPQFLMDEDLVIVTVNYRLGIFGFLSLESKEMPGNMGMKDQVMALKWVQNNIANFGGNPKCVTIIGESSGGASVYLHLISPLSKGLYHRAIAESGTAYNPWSVSPPGYAKSLAMDLLSYLKCSTQPEAALACITNKTSEEILNLTPKFTKYMIDPIVTFGPNIEQKGTEGAFLQGPAKEWTNNPVPLILGFTSAEGLFRTLEFIRRKEDFKSLSKEFNDNAPVSLLYHKTASNPANITKQIRKFYLPRDEITLDDWRSLTNLYTDAWFSIGVLDGAYKHTGKTFLYYFEYNTTTQGQPLPPVNGSLLFGPNHCYEAMFIWKYATPLTNKETYWSKIYVKVLAQFAKEGVPKYSGSNWEGWKEFTPNIPQTLSIKSDGISYISLPIQDRYTFWKSINYRDNFEVSSSATPSMATGFFWILLCSTALNYLKTFNL